jgi:glycosyltransferase involved in cell wall biosynthesis
MATIGILLCTLNGARFLPRQLASIEAQSLADWRLFVSDDGSVDGTAAILADFGRRVGAERVTSRRGPGKGFVANFLSLACAEDLGCDYYAFADQDDIWEPDKLARALQRLAQLPEDAPTMYCSRTRLIDADGRDEGFSPLFNRPTGFSNALVQNIAGGNTMVFNETARRLLVQSGPDVQVPAHDWLLYLLITAAGGRVIYDPYPTVRYRIHRENLIGSNMGWHNRGLRAMLLLRGRFRQWTDQNIAALARILPRMPAENRRIFELFRRARGEWLIRRTIDIIRCGVYRQTWMGNLGLVVAVLTRRL